MRTIEEIVGLGSIDGIETNEAFDVAARLIDHAGDKGDLSLVGKSLDWCDALEARGLSAEHHTILYYFRASAWACRYAVKRGNRSAVWSWDQPEIKEQVLLLRRALNSAAFPNLHVFRRCQILTNLGNLLDTLGRFVEARTYWTDALQLEPKFWMARGNRGRGLMHYANALYDPGHREVFALHAHGDLLSALIAIDAHPALGDTSLMPFFAESAASIGRAFDLEAIESTYRPSGYDLGSNFDEKGYRRWCLKHVLFLNPLNDVASCSIAGRDVMTLPSFSTAIHEPPVLVGFFNQLKQEFVSARWLYYDAIRSTEPHPSDHEVLLYNTLDYPAYGLSVEKVKVAFRMAYSTFDKIALFLNRYLSLGIPEKRVSFRSIWREKEASPVRIQFETSENWPFRGLYWLSQDLFEAGMQDITEPDAQALHELRNHLEHKYVKVHEIAVVAPSAEAAAENPFFDDFAYAISRTDLERKTLRLLKLVRAAMIYLSLGMHREEQRRREADDEATLIMPMDLDTWRDEWKR
jgi:hypothetical protein